MTEFWFWCDIFDEKLVIVICPILSIYLFILCVSYQSFFTHFFPAWMTWHLCILADTFIHIEFRSIDQFMLPLEIKHMTLALNNWQLLLLFQNDWILTSESHIYMSTKPIYRSGGNYWALNLTAELQPVRKHGYVSNNAYIFFIV